MFTFLQKLICNFLLFCATLFFLYGCGKLKIEDLNAPSISGSTITALQVLDTSFTFTWGPAIDDTTKTDDLQYSVYYSMDLDNVSSVVTTLQNATLYGAPRRKQLYRETIEEVEPDMTYYITVVVEDQDGNRNQYRPIFIRTLLTVNDLEAPMIHFRQLQPFEITDTSVSIRFIVARDSISLDEALVYSIYGSENSYTTITDIESSATPIKTITHDIETFTPKIEVVLTDLITGDIYNIYVIVEDERDNKALYAPLSVLIRSVGYNVRDAGGDNRLIDSVEDPMQNQDTTPPTLPTSATITVDTFDHDTIIISWDPATDNKTMQDNLSYTVYYDTEQDNVDSIDNLANASISGAENRSALVSETITDLLLDTTYYINVLVVDEASNATLYTLTMVTTLDSVDLTPPTVTNPNISSVYVDALLVEVSWNAATDTVSTADFLLYSLYYSTSNNITSVADAMSNGTLVGTAKRKYFLSDIVLGLSTSQSYYFNVIVEDQSGNTLAYTPVNITTSALDTTAPTLPTSTISLDSSTTSTVSVYWNVATDLVTTGTYLRYSVYESSSNNITSVSDVMTNGSLFGDAERFNLTSETLTGYSPADAVYINVLVQDGSDNYIAYTSLMVDIPCASISGIGTAVNDPLVVEQWYLQDDPMLSSYNASGDDNDINVNTVWDCYRGENILIAVLDDGLEVDHPDLSANHAASYSLNYNTGTNDPFDSDEPHGTNVTGIIAARDSNSIGMLGIAPRVQFYGRNLIVASQISNYIDSFTDHDEITAVYNNSWSLSVTGGRISDFYSSIFNAMNTAVTSGYGGLGSSIVFAAGNGRAQDENSNYSFVTNYIGSIAVASIESDGTLVSYSEPGANLWISAPGGGIINRMASTDLTGEDGYNNSTETADLTDRDYTRLNTGTSFSAPVVSGVIALIRQVNVNLTWRDVKLILADSADQNDATNTSWITTTNKYSDNTSTHNFHHDFGFGKVNAYEATELAKRWTLLPSLVTFRSSIQTINTPVPDNSLTGISDTLDLTSTGITFIEYIYVHITSDHPYFGDLAITLLHGASGYRAILSPSHDCYEVSGETEVVVNHATGICGDLSEGGHTFGISLFLGYSGDASWSIEVADLEAERTGNLESWSITIYGH